ncbi:MAG: TonB-dependent receptor [Steroidobacteraceae bacterium]
MRNFLICSTSLLVTIAGATPALSQDASEISLEEIVVTATKRDTDLQKTLILIQVVSGEQLKAEGRKRIDEIMSGTVGVQVQDSPTGASFYMRGFNGTPFSSNSGAPDSSTVAVVIDGVVQSRSETVRGGTLDMARAEVMRGSQSTTLGGNSLVGAVSLISNQPIFEYAASGSLEVGNYHLLATEGVLNVPVTDNQAIRIAYSSNKRNGYVSSGAGDSDLLNARLKYRWQATDNLNLVATIDHQTIGGNGVTQNTLLYSGSWVPFTNQCPTTPTQGATVNCFGYPYIYAFNNSGVTYRDRSNPWSDGFPKDGWYNNPYYDSTIDSINVNASLETAIGTLTLIPSYQKTHFASMEPGLQQPVVHQDQKPEQKQLDLRFASPGESSIEWLGGLYYQYVDSPGVVETISPPGTGTAATTAGFPTPNYCATAGNAFCYWWRDTRKSFSQTLSAYGNFTYPIPFVESLRLIGGARYSEDKKGYEVSTAQAGTSFGPSTAYNYSTPSGTATYANNGSGAAGEAKWHATTYRAGLEYDVLDNAMAYGTVSTGYQPGSISATNGITPKLRLKQITLGLKSRWLEDSLQTNVEAFRSQFYNQSQGGGLFAYVPTNPSNTVPANPSACSGMGAIAATGGTAGVDSYVCATGGTLTVPYLQSQGADLELSYLPTASDRIDVTVEYLETTQTTPNFTRSDAEITSALGNSTNTAALLSALQASASLFDGKTQQNSPKWNFNTTYSHRFTLPGGSTLTPKANWVHKSEYWSSGFGAGINLSSDAASFARGVQPAYDLYNGYLNWQSADSKFNISSYVKNITNEAILLNYNAGRGVAYNFVSLDAPRTYGVNFSANF